jgi:hypothetical protein
MRAPVGGLDQLAGHARPEALDEKGRRHPGDDGISQRRRAASVISTCIGECRSGISR